MPSQHRVTPIGWLLLILGEWLVKGGREGGRTVREGGEEGKGREERKGREGGKGIGGGIGRRRGS